jgi:hypothetical protein
MDEIVFPTSHVVCFHRIRTGHQFIGSFEGLVVIQRLCCTLYSRDVAESIVQRHGAAVPISSADKLIELLQWASGAQPMTGYCSIWFPLRRSPK